MHKHEPVDRPAICRIWRLLAAMLAIGQVLFAPDSLVAIASVGTVMPGGLAAGDQTVVQPQQPASGPGGRDYRFNHVHAERLGELPSGVTVFRPEGIDDATRAKLPVVLFLHGFTANNPVLYGGWIEHLVRRGAVVLYPDYQEVGVFSGGQEHYIDNMFAGVRDGLAEMSLKPERVHVVGHSLGAVLAMVYSTTAAERGLPEGATLTMIEPGGCRNCGGSFGFGVPVQLDRRLLGDTLVSIVVGEDDSLVGDADALVLARMAANIPPDRQRLMLVQSDDHGQPALVADHLLPQTAGSGGEEDALDWYGLWRPFDALVACADAGQHCDVALGDSEVALSMGYWSDGTPVEHLSVRDPMGQHTGSNRQPERN